MSTKRKYSPLCRGFEPPSKEACSAAVGNFPWAPYESDQLRQQAFQSCGNVSGVTFNCSDINIKDFYVNEAVWPTLPLPLDNQSWLANYNEPGQTFDEYAKLFTFRNGQLRRREIFEKRTIYILPILSTASSREWPLTAPNLQKIAEWISIFLTKDVKILPFASLSPDTSTALRGRIKFSAPGIERLCEGRHDKTTGKFQTRVDNLLSVLAEIKQSGHYDSHRLLDAISVVGITMCDLYSAPSDLFIAGMASPPTQVAVLSFFRYHPHIKMHPGDFMNVGYAKRGGSYPYIETEKARPPLQDSEPLRLTPASAAEYHRRAGKLVIHELLHVFQLAHCIYAKCLMNGTGHLVEDFSSTPYLCGVCLRKLQLITGCDIMSRYRKLEEHYKENGLHVDRKWIRKRISTLEKMAQRTYLVEQVTREMNSSAMSMSSAQKTITDDGSGMTSCIRVSPINR